MFLERFIQDKYGKTVREENISTWRRTVSGDLTSVFRPYDLKEPALDYLDRNKFVVSIEKARYKELPSNYKKLTAEQVEQVNHTPKHSDLIPQQEEGIRPSCALPYELYADGHLVKDGTHYELHLTAGNGVHGTKAAGVPFNVYLRNLKEGSTASPEVTAATYAVKPGDTLTRQFPLSLFADSKCLIEVHGPNGFYRSFRGQPASSHSIEVRASYEQKGPELTGNMQVHIRNTVDKPLSIQITDNSYQAGTEARKVRPGQEESIVLHLKQSHGWYDFTVKADGSDIEARYAGRVETGNPCFSDPLIGGIA